MALHSGSVSRWAGCYALVTGASYGIGAELCRALTQHGIHVVGCARSVDKIQALASQLVAAGHTGVLHPYKCDLTSEDEIVAMFDWIGTRFGGVDICVNNAAINIAQPILGCRIDKLRQMLDLNVVALVSCDNKAITSMQARGVDDGHIFHINSALGHIVLTEASKQSTHAYGATKWAVTQITEALREELLGQGSGIRVTGISPAIVDTPMVQAVMGPEAGRAFLEAVPTLKARDVADTLLFALSAPASVQIKEIRLRATGASD